TGASTPVAFGGLDRLQMAQDYSEKNRGDVISRITNDPYMLDHPQAMNAALSYVNKIFESQSASYADQARQLKIQQGQQKIISDAAENDYLKQIYAPVEGAKPLSLQTIVNDPRLSNTAIQRLTKLIGGSEAHDDKTYGAGFVHAMQMVHAPQGTEGRITDPESLIDRLDPHGDPTTRLTYAGFSKLRDEINLKKSPEGNAESEITGTDEGLHIKDPKGDQLYLKFLAQVLPKYDAMRKEGKTPSQLLDPGSSDYIGKGMIDQPGHGFRRPMNQWFNDTIADQDTASGATPQAAAFDIKSVKALPDLIAAFRAGNVTRDQARAMALQNGWAIEKPKAPISQ